LTCPTPSLIIGSSNKPTVCVGRLSMMIVPITRGLQGSMVYLPASRPRRLLALVCCMLTFWTGFDSQVIRLLQTTSGNPTAPLQNPSSSQEDDDDDDYVLDQTEEPAAGRDLRRNVCSSPDLSCLATAKSSWSLSCDRRRLPVTPVWEHEYHNGIGAYLLC
jgi:hypothetical protein